MRCFAQYDEHGSLILIGKSSRLSDNQTEITESEYNALLAEIQEKAVLVDRLYSGEITIDEVPEAWREEIQHRVNERIAAEGEADEQEITGDEFLSMVKEAL